MVPPFSLRSVTDAQVWSIRDEPHFRQPATRVHYCMFDKTSSPSPVHLLRTILEMSTSNPKQPLSGMWKPAAAEYSWYRSVAGSAYAVSSVYRSGTNRLGVDHFLLIESTKSRTEASYEAPFARICMLTQIWSRPGREHEMRGVSRQQLNSAVHGQGFWTAINGHGRTSENTTQVPKAKHRPLQQDEFRSSDETFGKVNTQRLSRGLLTTSKTGQYDQVIAM